jgi:hypothetical protein
MSAAPKPRGGGVLQPPVRITRPPRRPRALRVLPANWAPKQGTPDECPTDVLCPYVECRYHLWRVDACDRMGRGKGHRSDAREAKIVPHSTATCALDYASERHSTEDVALMIGVSPRRVQQIVKLATVRAADS